MEQASSVDAGRIQRNNKGKKRITTAVALGAFAAGGLAAGRRFDIRGRNTVTRVGGAVAIRVCVEIGMMPFSLDFRRLERRDSGARLYPATEDRTARTVRLFATAR